MIGKARNPRLKIWKLIWYMEKRFCCEYSLSLTEVSQEPHPCSYSEGYEQVASGRPVLSSYWTTSPLEDPLNLHSAMIFWCLKAHRTQIIKITIKFIFRILHVSIRVFHNPRKTFKHTFTLWNLNTIVDYFTGLIYNTLNEVWL